MNDRYSGTLERKNDDMSWHTNDNTQHGHKLSNEPNYFFLSIIQFFVYLIFQYFFFVAFL
jgi:hypothetical protein